ncbi:hypothetical protein, conserved [Eimeria tenella]|uniref:Uncharacterized protein n=1 Tax=Eimeria tenella TaxID=5802 RepID=U6L3S8_EIMTE|nr:hypothetical protein, conserved [Eimeria tenella]CDJ43274.1 hypothetical protein, conserved [Eimeria tenella]|eukprot:XP_013234024.1 hypothetical protein, conserved [Eimeria tenella]
MGKVSKARKRKGRQQAQKSDAMDEDKPQNSGKLSETAKGEEEGAEGTSSHALFKRHASERKAVKQKIAVLKQRRKKLRKKFPKEAAEKREINKKIKSLIKEITDKHEKELKELGIIKTAGADELKDEDIDIDN